MYLDVDIYKPTITALNYFWERLSKNGILIIDDYNSVVINFEDIDTHDIESFSESLVNKSGLRRLDKQDRKITTLDENISEKLDGELNIRDLIGRVIGVEYPTKIYGKIKMRRVEL